MNEFNKEYFKRKQMRQALQNMKIETASELGINLEETPNDSTSGTIGTYAGPVGGEMVKKMIKNAEEQLASTNNQKK